MTGRSEASPRRRGRLDADEVMRSVDPAARLMPLTNWQASMLAVVRGQLSGPRINRERLADEQRSRITSAILKHGEQPGGCTAGTLSKKIQPKHRPPALLADMHRRGEIVITKLPTGAMTSSGRRRMATWYFVTASLPSARVRELRESSPDAAVSA